MIIRELRLQRGWSQDELGRISGLSARTIQRIERGDRPSLESAKALSAVFEVPLAQLQADFDHRGPVLAKDDHEDAQARDVHSFFVHLLVFLLAIAFFFALNRYFDPGFTWAWWPTMGWAIGLIAHGLGAFQVEGWRDLVSRFRPTRA